MMEPAAEQCAVLDACRCPAVALHISTSLCYNPLVLLRPPPGHGAGRRAFSPELAADAAHTCLHARERLSSSITSSPWRCTLDLTAHLLVMAARPLGPLRGDLGTDFM
ncbi:unnamed protein product [Urochloa humidicola]